MWIGARGLARMAKTSDYFWHGWTGNLTLKSLYGGLFPEGPPYEYPFSRAAALAAAISADPRKTRDRLSYLLRLRRQAAAVREFVRSSQA
jgi:hypothetical protein